MVKLPADEAKTNSELAYEQMTDVSKRFAYCCSLLLTEGEMGGGRQIERQRQRLRETDRQRGGGRECE